MSFPVAASYTKFGVSDCERSTQHIVNNIEEFGASFLSFTLSHSLLSALTKYNFL